MLSIKLKFLRIYLSIILCLKTSFIKLKNIVLVISSFLYS